MTPTETSHTREVSGEILVEIDTPSIAAMVRDGTYYKKAREWYSSLYHAPIAERCYFSIVIVLALLNTMFAISAFMRLLPIAEPVPFVTLSGDVFAEKPRIELIGSRGDNMNEALKHYLVKNYVMLREEYKLDKFERDVNFVRHNSTPQIYLAYRRMLDPPNPSSPILRYERHSTRDINVTSAKLIVPGEKKDSEGNVVAEKAPPYASVEFNAVVRGPQGVEKTQWVATVTYDYTPVVVDQETSEVSPMKFTVTGYEVREKVITEQ